MPATSAERLVALASHRPHRERDASAEDSCIGTSENVSRLKNACGNDTATATVAPAAAQARPSTPEHEQRSSTRPPAGGHGPGRLPPSQSALPSSAG
jgi:hypothetical protein